MAGTANNGNFFYLTSGTVGMYSCTATDTWSISGTVTSSGSPVSGNISKFTTATNIAPAAASDIIALFTGCSGTQYLGADGACHAASGAQAWSAITSSTANLSLSNAAYTTTFNQTSGVIWEWANTTAATATVAQSSPIIELCGTNWNGSASAVSCYQIQDVETATKSSTFTVSYLAGGPDTTTTNTSLPGNVSAASFSTTLGIVSGLAPLTLETTTSWSMGATYVSGYYINQYATAATAITATLPTAAAGKQYCIANGNNGSAADTGALTVQTSASGQYIEKDGTLSASGGYIISGGAAGDKACFIGLDTTHWEFWLSEGTWTLH